MKKLKILLLLLFVSIFMTGCFGDEPEDNSLLKGKHDVIITVKDYGVIELELDADSAPITVTNFMNLVRDGAYDGNVIHRADKDLGVIQGGNISGAETIKGEFLANGVDNTISHVKGVISMARAGSISDGYDTASSQFFITTKDVTQLDNYYAAFGKVTKGMDIVDKIVLKVTKVDSNGMVLDDTDMPKIEYIKKIEK